MPCGALGGGGGVRACPWYVAVAPPQGSGVPPVSTGAPQFGQAVNPAVSGRPQFPQYILLEPGPPAPELVSIGLPLPFSPVALLTCCASHLLRCQPDPYIGLASGDRGPQVGVRAVSGSISALPQPPEA